MKFSIVMATMNAEKYLDRALRSICEQSYDNYEVIIQDGGSTDTSAAIAARFGDKVLWRSERDSGIYDAWNKALERLGGDWILFLGADDMLWEKTTLERAAALLQDSANAVSFAYGDLFIGTNGQPELLIKRSLRAVYTLMLNTMGLPFPATFVRASIFEKTNFNTDFRIAGDYDFAARQITADNVLRLPLTVAYMEDGGISHAPAFEKHLRVERERVLRSCVLPRAAVFVEGCIKYMDEGACCGSKKRIKSSFFKTVKKRLGL